jgi:hypothetical protein
VRRTALLLALGTVYATLASSAYGQVPSTDSVEGQGQTRPSGALNVSLVFDVSATSGPSGETPSGYVSLDVVISGTPTFHLEGRVSCLSVSGRDAVVGFEVDRALSNFPTVGGIIEMRDNGPPGADPPDVLNAIPADDPSACSPLPVPPALEVVEGDVSVFDALPLPTSKSECKNGGYAGFGFSNQGQCIAFVERGAK